MQKPGLTITILAFAILAALVWNRGSSASESTTQADPNDTSLAIPGPLDGKSFKGAIGPDGKAKDVPDIFVFENGTFVSKECELRCKYPARPYFVRSNGNRTEFISETKCPYKDAKIIWRGTIKGDHISGKSTWIVKRWYWTVENTFEFEGKLIDTSSASASSN